jgi:hypothetical protein
LLVGFCFGLGYGVTHRLLALQLPSLVRLGQGFEVRPFPGTSLESLRLRFGTDSQEIRGDLDLLELEPPTNADKPEATPEPNPLDPVVEAEPQPREPNPQRNLDPAQSPRLEAPPPPQLPSADLPQFSPEAGQR